MSDDAPRLPGDPGDPNTSADPAEAGAEPWTTVPSSPPPGSADPGSAEAAGTAEPASAARPPEPDAQAPLFAERGDQPAPDHERAAASAPEVGPGAHEPEPGASEPGPGAPEPPRFVEPAPERPPADWGELSDAFLTIWTRPRETIRRIVAVDPTYWLLPLASLGGGSSFLGTASSGDMGDRVSVAAIIIMAVVAGPVLGIAGVYLFGWLVARSGAWLQGGRGDLAAVRAALAWGYVPYIAMLPLLLLASVLIPGMYQSDMSRAGPVGATPGVLLGVIASVLGIWSLVLTCQTVAEVQGYRSAWRGLVNVILPGVLCVVAVVVLVLVLGGFAALLHAL